MRKTITDTWLKTAKPAQGVAREDWFDALTPGLCVRLSANKKTWTFFFTVPGSKDRARLALGSYPATGLDAARKRAMEALGHLEGGTDPRTLSAATERPKTVRELWNDRLAMKVTGKLRSADLIEWRFNKHILPAVGDVAVKDFKIDPHYNKVMDPIVKRGTLRMAGQVHTDLVTLMNFAVQRGVIEYSRITKAESPDPKNVKTRFLSVEEIPAFWNTLPDALARSKSCQRILKLCLATGQRLSEVAGMTRGEFDWAAMVWTIPADRVKNGKKYGAHAVPLSPLAASIIREALTVNSNQTDYLFPNDAGTGPLAHNVICCTLRRALDAGDFKLGKFTAHDLRRTVATQMSLEETGLQIPELYISHVLNHRSATHGTITAKVYNQNKYLAEKREALEKWGAFLAKMVGHETEMREAA